MTLLISLLFIQPFFTINTPSSSSRACLPTSYQWTKNVAVLLPSVMVGAVMAGEQPPRKSKSVSVVPITGSKIRENICFAFHWSKSVSVSGGRTVGDFLTRRFHRFGRGRLLTSACSNSIPFSRALKTVFISTSSNSLLTNTASVRPWR